MSKTHEKLGNDSNMHLSLGTMGKTRPLQSLEEHIDWTGTSFLKEVIAIQYTHKI